jgi:chromosome segregation ATPase
MAETPEHKPAETEKGFGTGLRAQLQRRQEETEPAEAQGTPNVELRFELTARPSADAEPVAANADLSALKLELEAAQRREEALRLRLEKQTEAFDDGGSSHQELARRAATLDEREAKLSEFETTLEERERKVLAEREAIELEHARVAELQAEAAAEQQLALERQEQAEARLRGLKGADRDREKAKAELSKQFAALADREKKTERRESAPRMSGSTAASGRSTSARPSSVPATRRSESASAGWSRARPI